MLNGISSLVNSCFKDRIRRCFYIALWPTMKNMSTTMFPSAENHEECLDMPPRRRPDRIFTVLILCSTFGETSLVYYELLKPSQIITGNRYRTQLMRLNRALKEKRPQYHEIHDKVIIQHDNAWPHVARPVKTQKTHCFFQMVSNNCQKDGKK